MNVEFKIPDVDLPNVQILDDVVKIPDLEIPDIPSLLEIPPEINEKHLENGTVEPMIPEMNGKLLNMPDAFDAEAGYSLFDDQIVEEPNSKDEIPTEGLLDFLETYKSSAYKNPEEEMKAIQDEREILNDVSKDLELPDFSSELLTFLEDFPYSRHDIAASFRENHFNRAHLFSIVNTQVAKTLKEHCLSAILLDHYKDFVYLGYLSVLRKYRRQRIGNRIMKIVIRTLALNKKFKKIYLIARNIKKDDGHWFLVKDSPVYKFWESLNFRKIQWNKLPHIPDVLGEGEILNHARVYMYDLTNIHREGENIPLLKKQVSEIIKILPPHCEIKVFAPFLASKQIIWADAPGKEITEEIKKKDSALERQFIKFYRRPDPQQFMVPQLGLLGGPPPAWGRPRAGSSYEHLLWHKMQLLKKQMAEEEVCYNIQCQRFIASIQMAQMMQQFQQRQMMARRQQYHGNQMNRMVVPPNINIPNLQPPRNQSQVSNLLSNNVSTENKLVLPPSLAPRLNRQIGKKRPQPLEEYENTSKKQKLE